MYNTPYTWNYVTTFDGPPMLFVAYFNLNVVIWNNIRKTFYSEEKTLILADMVWSTNSKFIFVSTL